MSLIERIVQRLFLNRITFSTMQRFGVHVIPNHFYFPVPDTRELGARPGLWEGELGMAGVDMNEAAQVGLLKDVFPRWLPECNFPLDRTSTRTEYFINNNTFGYASSAVLHCMIRHFRPRRILEVGSGFSTLVSARACRMNRAEGHDTRLVSIEPYPREMIRDGVDGLSHLIPEKVENVRLAEFADLGPNDILFIDSSHVVRIGGDVNFLYLEVLPRLKPGVLIHIHDIFLPRDYPRDWVLENHWFWTEQYLLQAFLAFNSSFEVLWSGGFMYSKHLEDMLAILPPPGNLGRGANYFSSSFWMRRL